MFCINGASMGATVVVLETWLLGVVVERTWELATTTLEHLHVFRHSSASVALINKITKKQDVTHCIVVWNGLNEGSATFVSLISHRVNWSDKHQSGCWFTNLIIEFPFICSIIFQQMVVLTKESNTRSFKTCSKLPWPISHGYGEFNHWLYDKKFNLVGHRSGRSGRHCSVVFQYSK